MDQIDAKQIAPSGAVLQQPLVFDAATQHWVPIGTAPLSVATLAARPAVATLPNGTLVFVETQRSWYRSDLISAAYLREPTADPSWMAQPAWGIDTAAGNDENVGTVASPLLSWAELRARLPALNANVSITIAAGSVFGAGDAVEWQPILAQTTGATPVLSITGARTLGANVAVVAASDELGNASPLLDIGVALTPGQVVQVTTGAQTGATTTVQELVAATSYRVTKWRSGAAVPTSPPAPGDNVAMVTLVSVSRFSFSSSHIIAVVNGFSITTLDVPMSRNNVFQVCVITGSLSMNFPTFMQFDGCCCLGNSFVGMQASGVNVLASLTGFVRTGGSVIIADVAVANGARLQLTNCLITGGGGLDISVSGQVNANHLGIFDTPVRAIDVHNQGYLNITNTLYGDNNTGKGTRVREGGRVQVLSSATPTLASALQELELENAAVANPVAAGVPAAAAPLTTWAGVNPWNGAPFNRNVVSYTSGAAILNQT